MNEPNEATAGEAGGEERERELIAQALRGDQAALEGVVGLVKDLVFNLAVRMLGNPGDAEDASQEILVRVVTALSTFRGESSFRTWVYRVAANHLLRTRKRQMEQATESLDALAEDLAQGLADSAPPVEEQVLVNEAKLICSSRMLLGLDRDHRLAFILGEILSLSAEEGSAICEVTPEAFRKRLSRARQAMAEFAKGKCGLVDPSLPCRCGKQMAHHIKLKHFDPKKPMFAPVPTRSSLADQRAQVDAIEGLQQALEVVRSHRSYAAPRSVVEAVRKVIESGTLQ